MSVARRYSGRGNPPLTSIGLGQAAAVATRLAPSSDITAVVQLTAVRARQTAETIGSAVGIRSAKLDDLTETDFGAWRA